MENQIIGIIGTVVVAFFIVLVFAVGFVTIVKRVKELNQDRRGNYITEERALAITNQNNKIEVALKALQTKKA